MKTINFLFKTIVAMLLLAASVPGFAQTATDLPEKSLRLVMEDKGDSLFSLFNADLQKQITPQALKGVFPMLEMQMGKLKKRGAWRQEEVMGLLESRCRMDFERAPLDFVVMTNDKGELISLTFQPAKEEMPAPSNKADKGYVEIELEIKNGGITLPATLTLPRTKAAEGGTVPAVVLIHGSGPNDRDETLGPNKFFADLADSLAHHGIATLRYDKRTFVYKEKTSEVSGGKLDYDTEITDDALAAIRLLAAQNGIDAKRIYILGHSLGGRLVPRIAEKAGKELAGAIAVAAPARPFETVLMEQLQYINKVQGRKDTDAKAQYDQMMTTLPKEYVDFDHKYDPFKAAKSTSLPMLFMGGGNDYQVTDKDMTLWKKELRGRQKVEFWWGESLDHLMRPLTAKAVPADYMRKEPISGVFVSKVMAFINNQ